MEIDLIRVIEAEAQKERQAILDEARTRARAIMDQARRQAERTRAFTAPADLEPTTADSPEPEGADRWGCACQQLSTLQRQRVTELKECAARRLASLDEATRQGLLATVFEETLGELKPDRYHVQAPGGVLQLIPKKPRGFDLELSALEGDEVTISSTDRMLVLRWSLDSMVERYLALFEQVVTERMLGDGAA